MMDVHMSAKMITMTAMMITMIKMMITMIKMIDLSAISFHQVSPVKRRLLPKHPVKWVC